MLSNTLLLHSTLTLLILKVIVHRVSFHSSLIVGCRVNWTSRKRNCWYLAKRTQTRVSLSYIPVKFYRLSLASASSSSVKRVVVTSSCASVMHFSPHPLVFSEVDWNEQSIKEIEEKGSSAPNDLKYRASKTLAEKGESRSSRRCFNICSCTEQFYSCMGFLQQT